MISIPHSLKLIDAFKEKRVMIIGDAMLDAYWMGKVNRISPEAPVPVLEITDKQYKLGGAANVALNIKSLGAVPFLFSIIGNDSAGENLLNLLQNEHIDTRFLQHLKSRITTVKIRVMSQAYHILRMDEEQSDELASNDKEKLQKKILSGLEKIRPDVVIIQDYEKGMLYPELIDAIIKHTEKLKIKTAVDPKKKNFWNYKNVTLFKPNLRELTEASGNTINVSNIRSLKTAEAALRKKLNHKISLITLSADGVYVSSEKENFKIAAHERNITDVSGAGDTVISVAALCLAANANIQTIAALSNLAGGLVCEKRGVAPITSAQLKENIKQLN